MSAARLLLPGLILGALIRLLTVPLTGTGDVYIWKVWSFAASNDLTGVYGVGGSPPERRILHWQEHAFPVDYPPLAVEELAVVGHAYRWAVPSFRDSRVLNISMKLPGLAAEVLLIAAVLTWGRRRFGEAAAAWTALAIWLNPGVIADGPLLGYLDPQAAIPAAAALVAAFCGPAWLAGVLAAIGLMTKAQVVFALPAIGAVLVWRPANRVRAVAVAFASGSAVCLLLTLPYVIRGAWANLTQALSRLATHDMLSANAANAWWVFTWALRVLDVAGEWGWRRALTQEVRILAITRATALGYPNARGVGLALVVAACGCMLWRMRRTTSLAQAAALAGWTAYAYALWAAQVHENHLSLALPFLTIAAGLDRRYRSIFYWVSAIFTLNLLMFYGFGREFDLPLDRRWTLIDASVLLAIMNLGVFAWSTRRIFSSQKPRARSQKEGVSPAREKHA